MLGSAAWQGRFWRYNYRILTGTGYWVLVAPVAASQIVTLWMFAMSSGFGQGPATRIAELMTPILGAFFVAHSLAPEYRSGVGAVLASKPVSLGRVLAMRVSVGLLAALALTVVTLAVCSLGLSPIEMGPPLAACLPSLWFYSTLALLFATIFRNPLGGFAVPLGLWSLDLALGFGSHPLLSVQGFSAHQDTESLSHFWSAGKALQAALGTLFWWVHTRQLTRICRPPEGREVLRIVAAAAVLVAAYAASGAGTLVAYAYGNRGALPMRDVMWLRRSLSVYGPLPVARLFGPAFAAYLAEPPPAADGVTPRSVRTEGLERALNRWPGSRWADSIAFTLAQELEGVDAAEAVRAHLLVADRYPDSPFAPRSLAIIARQGDLASDAERLLAGRRLLADYPDRREAEAGADALEVNYPARVRGDEFLAAALTAAEVAPEQRRPEWRLRAAEVAVDLGRRDDARRLAAEAAAAARALERRIDEDREATMELQPHRGKIAATAARAEALRDRLSGS